MGLSTLGYLKRVARQIAEDSLSCYYEDKCHLPSDRQIRRLLVTASIEVKEGPMGCCGSGPPLCVSRAWWSNKKVRKPVSKGHRLTS